MMVENKTRIHITNKSILELDVDTIVNSANALPAVGVPYHGKMSLDYQIYDASGYHSMLAERKKCGYLKKGSCCTTSSYKLSDRGIQRVIHVNVPSNKDPHQSAVTLGMCYYNVLCEAKKCGSTKIAFPLLGTGNKNFNVTTAIKVMRTATENFLLRYQDYPIDITISIIDEGAFQAASFILSACEDPSRHFVVPEFSYVEAENKGYFRGRGKKSLVDEVEIYKVLYDSKMTIDSVITDFDRTLGIEFTEYGAINRGEDNPLLEKIRKLNSERKYTQESLASRSNLSLDQVKSIYANKRGYSRNSIIGLCFGFELSITESAELMRVAGFAFQDTWGDRTILEGIKNMNSIVERGGKEISEWEMGEIIGAINDKLLERKIEYVFVGNKRRYLEGL